MDDTSTTVSGDIRIFRVVEGTGETIVTANFTVPVAFLSVSTTLDPMTSNDGMLRSDDNVIPFEDSIRSIEALVNWMTRKKGFTINDDNMRELAILADKYEIESLTSDLQLYTERYIARKEPQSFNLWLFAARYSMHDLEAYCRADSSVFTEIKSIISDPSKGIKFLMREKGFFHRGF